MPRQWDFTISLRNRCQFDSHTLICANDVELTEILDCKNRQLSVGCALCDASIQAALLRH